MRKNFVDYSKKFVFICIPLFLISITFATSININHREKPIEGRQIFRDPFFYDGFDHKLNFILNVGQYVQQTTDNGYIVTGYQGDIDTSNPNSYNNVKTILLKYDENGNKEWNKTFDFMDINSGYSILQTEDLGYIIGGSIVSSEQNKAMLLKTDEQGNEEWLKTYEGLDLSRGTTVQITNDSGYILTGSSTSLDDIYTSHILLVKTDSDGNEEWNKTYSFTNSSIGNSVQQTEDLGHIICGYIIPNDVLRSSLIIIKTDNSGNEQWNKTFDFMDMNSGYSIQQTDDLGYIISGIVISSEDLISHALLLKTDENGIEEWHQTYKWKYGYYAQQTNDFGYILGGTSFYQIPSAYLLKTDDQGNEEWVETYIGEGNTEGIMVQQTNDNGYILTGTTFKPFSFTRTYVLLLKTDVDGNIEWRTNLNKNIIKNNFINSFLLKFLERYPLLQRLFQRLGVI
jgi:hypothetical protein